MSNDLLIDRKKKDQEDWDKLYKYVKDEILQYDTDMKLPKFMVLRLKGLASGNFIANKTQKPQANYGFDTILLTFKACKLDILKYTKQNMFNDEKHKFNYIMVIVENNINDIVMRLKSKDKQIDRMQIFEPEQIVNSNVAQYQKKTKENKSKLLNNLW